MPGRAQTPAVTPAGVRDGDPAALAGLCARRGPAGLAYCEELCSPELAARAAAEAFARFRAAVVAADDPAALDPEGVLLGATRRATAALAGPSSGRRSLRDRLAGRARAEPC